MWGTGPPGQPMSPTTITQLFTYRLGPAVALFLLLSAALHLLVASPWGFPRYCADLAAGRNRFRWIEYSLSASLMIVLIAGISCITDIAALFVLFNCFAVTQWLQYRGLGMWADYLRGERTWEAASRRTRSSSPGRPVAFRGIDLSTGIYAAFAEDHQVTASESLAPERDGAPPVS